MHSEADVSLAGNYTCTVRNGLGSDTLSVAVHVRAPPAPPAPRLRSTAAHALQLSWDKPSDGGAHILGNKIIHNSQPTAAHRKLSLR